MASTLLRTALTANAVFSFTSGCALALFGSAVASLILAQGRDGSWLLRGVGVGLIGFAILLGGLARDRGLSTKQVSPIIFSDFAWVLLSVALIVLAPGALTTTGREIVTAIAAIVAILGSLQWYGLRRMTPPKDAP